MKNNNTLNFFEGAVAGTALGVGASIFLASKKGKDMRNKLEKMGEKEYKDFMKNAAKQYAKAKKIPGNLARELIKNSQESWKNFSEHLEN